MNTGGVEIVLRGLEATTTEGYETPTGIHGQSVSTDS